MSDRPIYTIKRLHDALFKDAQFSQAALRAVVIESGCYFQIGQEVMLSERHVERLISYLSATTTGAEAADSDVGLLVVLANMVEIASLDDDEVSLVYVDWCERGSELELLEKVAFGYPAGRLSILTAIDMTYGDAKEVKRTLAAQRFRHNGNWFIHKAVPIISQSEKDAGGHNGEHHMTERHNE